MQHDTWQTTQVRVQAWRDRSDETGVQSAWELRRILAASQWMPEIIKLVLERSPFRDQASNAENYWAFGLEHLPEDAAIGLLMSVIQEGMPARLDEISRASTLQWLTHAKQPAEQSAVGPAVRLRSAYWMRAVIPNRVVVFQQRSTISPSTTKPDHEQPST